MYGVSDYFGDNLSTSMDWEPSRGLCVNVSSSQGSSHFFTTLAIAICGFGLLSRFRGEISSSTVENGKSVQESEKPYCKYNKCTVVEGFPF